MYAKNTFQKAGYGGKIFFFNINKMVSTGHILENASCKNSCKRPMVISSVIAPSAFTNNSWNLMAPVFNVCCSFPRYSHKIKRFEAKVGSEANVWFKASNAWINAFGLHHFQGGNNGAQDFILPFISIFFSTRQTLSMANVVISCSNREYQASFKPCMRYDWLEDINGQRFIQDNMRDLI